MKKRTVLVLVLPTLLAASSCAVDKSENPLSPTLAGPIPGVEISAPKPLEPGTGALIPGDKQPLTLLIENAYSTGPRPLNYLFEVATDAGFGNKVFTREGVEPGDGGRTSLRLPDALGTGRGYFWRAKAQDGANTGPYSNAIAFTVFTPISFDKPTLTDPINNELIQEFAPEFRLNNAPRTGAPSGVSYILEVAPNSAFSNKYAIWQFSEQPHQTAFQAPAGLPPGTQMFWRAQATAGGIAGPWSDTGVFRTPVPVVVAPTPAPGGGACSTSSTELGVVQCQRSNFPDHMSTSQIVSFLRAAARDLNKHGFSPGGFGILRKGGGANCGGYSCDIICSGGGNSQKQWDVLLDAEGAQSVTWNGPHTYPHIRIDTCEVQ